MNKKKGFFEALGSSMDEDLRQIQAGLHQAKEGARQMFGLQSEVDQQDDSVTSISDVVRALLQQVGKDVELKAIDETFEYNDIISWVRKNAVGNKFYVAKGSLENDSDNVLCVFFGVDDSVLYGPKFPKICLIYKKLNSSISDLFVNGAEVYVKSFKIL